MKLEISENNSKNRIILQKFNQEIKNLKENTKNSTKFQLDDFIRLKTEPIVKKKRYLSVKAYKDDKDEAIEPFDTRNPHVYIYITNIIYKNHV